MSVEQIQYEHKQAESVSDIADEMHAAEEQVTASVEKASSLQSDVLRHARSQQGILNDYLNDGETVVGHGYGGSESITLFIEPKPGVKIVRKILSERFLTTKWEHDGENVMLHPCPKAKSQTEFLLGLPSTARPLFPEVLGVNERNITVTEQGQEKKYYEFMYDMSYVPGMEVSKFVREHKPSAKLVAVLYTVIFRYLRNRLHSQRRRVPRQGTLEQSYYSKIEKRLALCQRTAPQTFCKEFVESDWIILNGRHLRNVKSILAEFRSNPLYTRILEPRFHSLVVGDTNTENIKIGNIEPLLREYDDLSFENPPFTAEELEIRFLDPRAIGFHEDGVDTVRDDPMYDNKPWHNSMGNYDKIHGEHFDMSFEMVHGVPMLNIDFHAESPYSKSYDTIEKYFADSIRAAWGVEEPTSDVRQNDPYWLFRFVFMMGTHFMAMPPYHFSMSDSGVLIDNAEHQRRPLAVYAEGIKWLNLALDMLEGRVRTFYGLPVPKIGTGYDEAAFSTDFDDNTRAA